MELKCDRRIVMTLDAGGTGFRFAAMQGCAPVTGTVAMPSNGDDLDQCLTNIVEGFKRIRESCPYRRMQGNSRPGKQEKIDVRSAAARRRRELPAGNYRSCRDRRLRLRPSQSKPKASPGINIFAAEGTESTEV